MQKEVIVYSITSFRRKIMRNVAIYVRVSTMHQAEQGYSIDSQLVDCRKSSRFRCYNNK